LNLKPFGPIDTYKRYIGNLYLHLQDIFIFPRNRGIAYSSVLIVETAYIHTCVRTYIHTHIHTYIHTSVLIVQAAYLYVT